MSSKFQALFILFLVTAFSCKSPNADEIPPLSPDMSQPIVTGIYVTNSMGPDPIGVWGNPSDGSSTTSVDYLVLSLSSGNNKDTISVLKRVSTVSSTIPTGVVLNLPYPNPVDTHGGCEISFALPYKSYVELFVVPARWFSEKSNDKYLSSGAVIAAPKRTAISILQRNQLVAGYWTYHWSGQDQNGNSLSDGFYRVYLHAYNTHYNIFYWHDVFLYNKISDLPIGLR